MILVTGGTGFVGRGLVRQLVALGKPVRLLLRPSRVSPNLPKGVSVEVAVSSLKDERGLRAAMKGVDKVFHLAGVERDSSRADLEGVDVDGTRMVAQVASQAGVERIFFLSHFGADRGSAYPVLKAKALGEHFVIGSGIPYTIVRSAPIFGPGDQFTTTLSRLLRISPGIFMMPGEGNMVLQPIWIEDLVACFVSLLERPAGENHVYSLGGSEFLTFRQILEVLAKKIRVKRQLVAVPQSYLRILALWIDQLFPGFPLSIFWLDYLSADRTCPADTLPRMFGIMPARFSQQLDYLVYR